MRFQLSPQILVSQEGSATGQARQGVVSSYRSKKKRVAAFSNSKRTNLNLSWKRGEKNDKKPSPPAPILLLCYLYQRKRLQGLCDMLHMNVHMYNTCTHDRGVVHSLLKHAFLLLPSSISPYVSVMYVCIYPCIFVMCIHTCYVIVRHTYITYIPLWSREGILIQGPFPIILGASLVSATITNTIQRYPPFFSSDIKPPFKARGMCMDRLL